MNKTIARRNNLGHGSHARANRRLARAAALQKWWNKYGYTDGGEFKYWSREEKKAFLLPKNSYDKWELRFERRGLHLDPTFQASCGRNLVARPGRCTHAPERKLRVSLVKVNALGRRRHG